MGIGIGGGLGPFRASVSTRGLGGSVGPVNFGTGWGSRRGSSGDIGTLLVGMFALMLLIVATMLAIIVVVWPYRVGSSMVDGGAGVALGSLFEAIYFVGALGVLSWVGSRQQRRLEQERLVTQYRRALLDHRTRITERRRIRDQVRSTLERAPAAQAEVEHLLGRIQHSPAGTEPAHVRNLPSDYPHDERFIGAGQGFLSAPRVATRGGPKVQTDVEAGLWLVTDRSIRFRGPTRTDQWPLARLEGVLTEPGRLLLPLRNRRTISGISAGDTEDDMVVPRALIAWAQALPGPPDAARALLETAIVSVDAEVQELHELLAELECELHHLETTPPQP